MTHFVPRPFTDNLYDPAFWSAVVSGCIAFLGVLITNAISWAKDLSGTAKRTRSINEAIQKVAFWDSWKSATEHLAPLTSDQKERMLRDLDRTSIEMERSNRNDLSFHQMTRIQYRHYILNKSYIAYSLLLFRLPKRYGGLRSFIAIYLLAPVTCNFILKMIHHGHGEELHPKDSTVFIINIIISVVGVVAVRLQLEYKLRRFLMSGYAGDIVDVA